MLDAPAPDSAALDAAISACASSVIADLDELVGSVVQAYADQLGSDGEDPLAVSRRTRAVLTCLLESTRDGRVLTPEDLSPFVHINQRAARGQALDNLLKSYRIAGALVWSAFMRYATAHGAEIVAALSLQWMGTIDVLTACAARAHLEASQEQLRSLDARRRELVEALISAPSSDVSEIGLRFSTVLHHVYTPVLVIGSDVVAQIDQILEQCPVGTLGGHRDAGGVRDRILLLVPGELDIPLWEASTPTDCLMVRGVCGPAGPSLLRAVQSVDATARAGLASGQVAGALGPDDLLVPRLLAADAELSLRLRRRLDGLASKDGGGVLVATLRTYLENGSIPETARIHDVHPNTVAYRLGRVQTLTGLDPRVPAQCVPLVLGLTLSGAAG